MRDNFPHLTIRLVNFTAEFRRKSALTERIGVQFERSFKTMNAIRFFLTSIILSLLLTGTTLAQNYKIRQTVSMNGQKSETTVYVRGARKRTEGGGFMGMGNDVATVEQCDLKRNVRINEQKKLYVIEPFDDGTDQTNQPTNQSKIQNPQSKIQKGGVVTYISNITDTGERKQMFGMTARHIKTSMRMEASPDACMKTEMSMETDGWYIDLPEFSCPVGREAAMPVNRNEQGGCRDRIVFRSTGGGKLGFALQETRTMRSEGISFTQTTETLEFSRGPLDAALFDIPGGYSLAKNSSDLYGTPDYSKIMQNPPDKPDDQENPANPVSVDKPKAAGVTRIGVYLPVNKTNESVSLPDLQNFLVGKLSDGKVEAVGVINETEARMMSCDYVLTSDLSKMKLSTGGKIGGIFGKVTNTDTSGMKDYEAQIDFKLVSLADGKTVAQSKATNKFKGDADKAAESVLALEARQVLSVVQK
jgi:hypothetical protein